MNLLRLVLALLTIILTILVIVRMRADGIALLAGVTVTALAVTYSVAPESSRDR